MADAMTDFASINESIGTIIAESIIKFQRANVMWNLMTNKKAVKGSGTVMFPIFTGLTESAVSAYSTGAEGTTTDATEFTSSGVSIEVLRKAISINLTDLSSDGSVEDMISLSSATLGNALAQKFDKDVLALSSGFSQSAGSDTLNITLDMLFNAIQLLKTVNAPTFASGNYACILHPKQIWGAYGISNFLGNILAPNTKSQEMVGTGYVTTIAGLDIYWSSEVGVASNIANGMIVSPQALGTAWKDLNGNGSFIDVRAQYQVSTASTKLVGNGYYAVAELVDTYGIELQTLVTTES